MLPLNIGLPKTPHVLSIDRCLEPCPNVIPTLTNQGSNQGLWVLTQCYLNTGPVKTTKPWPSLASTLAQSRLSCLYLLPGVCHGVKLKQLHQMAGTINSSFGGCVIQWCCFWVNLKITGGFRVLAPFTCGYIYTTENTVSALSPSSLIISMYVGCQQYHWVHYGHAQCNQSIFQLDKTCKGIFYGVYSM